MACCCREVDDHDDGREEGNPGPDIKRKCTNVGCLIPLTLCVVMHVYAMWYLRNTTTTDIMNHGRDHYRNMCGHKPREKLPFVYYPDLQTDIKKDPTLRQHYGVCVPKCPAQGAWVDDYDAPEGMTEGPATMAQRKEPGERWFVGLPSFPVLGRCVPYEAPPRLSGETEMCADPACEQIANNVFPQKPQEVCGLKRDGTDKYWLLSDPDVTLEEGWLAEKATQEVIKKRKVQAKEAAEERKDCEVIVHRGLRIQMAPKDGHLTLKFLTKYTGLVYSWCSEVYKERVMVFGLGIGGAMITSFIVICLLTLVARCVILLLLFLLFTVLGLGDYILFYLAGVASGRSGAKLMQAFNANYNAAEGMEALKTTLSGQLGMAAGEEQVTKIYFWSAIVLLVLIVVLMGVVVAIWKNFEVLIALLKEASHTVREMPSLLVFPFWLVLSMMVTTGVFLTILLGVATTDANDPDAAQLLNMWIKNVEPILEMLHLGGTDSFKTMQEAFLWVFLFHFVWAYFFHVAMFIGIIAFTVSNWYFYRHDPNRSGATGIHAAGWFPGKPVLVATYRLMRYHMGSMAMGSFIMTVVTLPRIILEYIDGQAGPDQNAVAKAIVWVSRCLLVCLERFLQFLTEYAYVQIAVTGKPFCTSAHASFVLFAKYPVQVSLDKMVCSAIGWLACTTVPAAMAVVSFLVINAEWLPCAIFIIALAYITTRLTVGVYDVCVTTLFVCVMRDSELYEGRYMSDALRSACRLGEPSEKAQASVPTRKSTAPRNWGIQMKDGNPNLDQPLAEYGRR